MRRCVLLAAVALSLPLPAAAARVTSQNTLGTSPIGVGESTFGAMDTGGSSDNYSSTGSASILPHKNDVPTTLPYTPPTALSGVGGGDTLPDPTTPDDESADSSRSASMLMFVGDDAEGGQSDSRAAGFGRKDGSAPSGLSSAGQEGAAPIESPLLATPGGADGDDAPPTYPVR